MTYAGREDKQLKRKDDCRNTCLLAPAEHGRKTLPCSQRLLWPGPAGENYRQTSPPVDDLKFHPLCLTKCRQPVIFAGVAVRLPELVREISTLFNLDIIKGHVSKGRIHLFVSVPP